MNDRTCQVKINDEWKEIEFENLKENDIFRLFENTGEEVIGDNGQVEFTASCDAFSDEDGIWCVDILW